MPRIKNNHRAETDPAEDRLGTLVLKDIEKWYGHDCGCAGINLQIVQGEFFTLLGPSGCGKTTILRLIAGFIKPDRGSILLGGRDITRVKPEKRDVGMVFQNYALFPFMTVRENIEYGVKIRKKDQSEVKKKVEHYLAMVGLEAFASRSVWELSGGEQQRVALARSLAVEPQVLLLDEPLSNLDARLRDTMRAQLKGLQKKLGITTIFVTHDQTEALTMSDRLAVFNRGQCIQTGTPEQIYHQPRNTFVAQFVGETNLFELFVKDGVGRLPNGITIQGKCFTESGFASIRPQHIALSRKPDGLDNPLPGIILEKQFCGLSSELIVESDGLLFRISRINTGPSKDCFPVGQQVWIGFSSEDIQLLDA